MRRIAAAALVAACVTGCSDGPIMPAVETAGPVGLGRSEDASSATPMSAPTDDARVVAKQYLEAFSTGMPASMDAMISLSEPGTAAHAFAVHQRRVAAVDLAEGLPPAPPQSVTLSGQTIEVCDGAGEDANCAAFAGFQALPNGKLITFTIDGTALDTRLLSLADRPAVTVGGVSARVVTAYRSIQSDTLEVTLEARNGTPHAVTIRYGDASYVTAGGRYSRAGQTGDSTDLQPGASVPVTVVFPGEDLGGMLTVDVDNAGTNDEIGSLRLPVR